jgi:hypothetical protein
MKYLSPQLSGEDLKRIYRTFAKLLHPDSPCGSEDAFKHLQSEYETCQKGYFEVLPFNDCSQDVRMYQNVVMPFGKHKGTLIIDLPKSYCLWCLDNLELSYLLKKAMEWKIKNI